MGRSLGDEVWVSSSPSTRNSSIVDVLIIVLVLGLLTALTVFALRGVENHQDEPITPPTSPSTTPPTTTPPTTTNPMAFAAPPRSAGGDSTHNPNTESSAPDAAPTASGATREFSGQGAVVDEGPERVDIPRERHWSALEGCDLANYLLDGARAEGKLSDEFYWILPLESNCRNDVVSYIGCCYGLLQLHRLFFNDRRLYELGLDHIVEGMHACGAFEIADIQQREAWSWQVNICAADVVYREHLRIHPNEPAECAWDPYMKRYWSSCPSRHN